MDCAFFCRVESVCRPCVVLLISSLSDGIVKLGDCIIFLSPSFRKTLTLQ